MPCGMWDLSFQPGTEPTPAALEGGFFNHWMTREVPFWAFLYSIFYVFILINHKGYGMSEKN